MKLAVNVLKANKAEWFLTYCLSKLWTFFLQDMDAKSLCVSCFQAKKNNWQDQGRKTSWDLLNTDTISGSEGS